MLDIKQLVFNPFDENTYLVSDRATGDAIVIDPGMHTPKEQKRFSDYVRERGLKIKEIVLTHMHLDHCFGVNRLSREYGVPVAASAADAILGVSIVGQATRFGIYLPEGEAVRAGVELADGDEVRFGDETLKVIAVPGHSPGGIALYSASGKVVFTGDSLFRRSIGRTDLPGGDYSWIMRSILDKIMPLGDDVKVYPGHGEETDLGHEALYNPFVTEVMNNEVRYE